MRLYSLALVASFVLASFGASSTKGTLTTSSDFSVNQVLTAGQKAATTPRFLRAEKVVSEDEDDDEERGVTSNLMSKLQNVFKSGALSKQSKLAKNAATNLTPQKQLTQSMLLKQQQHLDDAFTKLMVDKVEGNIFQSSAFKKWVATRQNFNKKNHIEDESGIAIVSKYFQNDVKLSGWIESARLDPNLKSMAEQFRAGQLNQWLAAGKHPDDVYKLLNVKKLGSVSQNRDMWRKYQSKYSTIWVTHGGRTATR